VGVGALDFSAKNVILQRANVYLFIGGIMAKKASKKREWTKADVRELKVIARHKTAAPKPGVAFKLTLAKPKKKPTSVSLSDIRRAVRAVDGTI
jgi:hypothetical protein